MTLRVAVVGGGPAGSSAAETLVKAGIETYIFERKLDNAKPCGGAIPLCMVGESELPPEIIDRRVKKMKMISPSNVEVNIGRQWLSLQLILCLWFQTILMRPGS